MMNAEAVMGTTWKPVQPTEIKDINIIREVIAQIRKPIPQEVYDRIAEDGRHLRDMLAHPIDSEVKARAWAAMKTKKAGAE
jgi:hypothetical protein